MDDCAEEVNIANFNDSISENMVSSATLQNVESEPLIELFNAEKLQCASYCKGYVDKLDYLLKESNAAIAIAQRSLRALEACTMRQLHI